VVADGLCDELADEEIGRGEGDRRVKLNPRVLLEVVDGSRRDVG
jgi:hypothetical protein